MLGCKPGPNREETEGGEEWTARDVGGRRQRDGFTFAEKYPKETLKQPR